MFLFLGVLSTGWCNLFLLFDPKICLFDDLSLLNIGVNSLKPSSHLGNFLEVIGHFKDNVTKFYKWMFCAYIVFNQCFRNKAIHYLVFPSSLIQWYIIIILCRWFHHSLFLLIFFSVIFQTIICLLDWTIWWRWWFFFL